MAVDQGERLPRGVRLRLAVANEEYLTGAWSRVEESLRNRCRGVRDARASSVLVEPA